MLNLPLFREWFYYLTEAWGLDPRIARFVAAGQTWLTQRGYQPVRITSGYRSPVRQRELQQRWDSGDRTGLVARPATRSWHMQGLAVDVSTRSESFGQFRDIMLYYGLRWGGNFRNYDPVHFDLPTGMLLSINQLLVSG